MNELLYTNEHVSCINYEQGAKASIELLSTSQDDVQSIFSKVNKIIFVLKNTIVISSDILQGFRVKQGELFFLPAGSRISVSCSRGTAKLLMVRFYEKIRLCESYSVENLFEKELRVNNDKIGRPYLLRVNTVMEAYLSLLISCHQAGLRCCNYNKGKIHELLFILRAFYPKEELGHFFSPIIKGDAEFSQRVMSGYNSCKSIVDLAQLTGYTISGFEKKFKKVYNESPYRWLTKLKRKDIYHCINSTSMTISQISDLFGFSSPSTFNDFVKRNFGKTPGQLRNGFRTGGNKE